ncbi:transmembrane protein [Thraustotheca clavata]|uniref:Transmembrane protein n=1 Tax=Thraustotheca clavata TaxID=74557 RepID=A0A1V9YJR2_9STRA|nr:transmembrane protein [Thraustotheca clavata]
MALESSRSGIPTSDRSRLLASASVPTHEEASAVRMNVLNSSVQEAREATSTRLMVMALAIFNLPQVLAGVIVLSLYWDDGEKLRCDRVKYWTLFHTIHLFLTVVVEYAVYYTHSPGQRSRLATPSVKSVLQSAKYCLELMGLFWFLVGNMWVISDEDHCSANGGGHIYNMAMAMVIICYIKIFLPCLILLALLPVVCFCLPCLIRILNRMQDPMRGKGATKEMIEALSSVKYTPDLFPPDEDASCCICLNEYTDNQELRILHCNHHFHKDCVDEWLVVNATCPTCRTSIDPNHIDASVSNTYRDPGMIV